MNAVYLDSLMIFSYVYGLLNVNKAYLQQCRAVVFFKIVSVNVRKCKPFEVMFTDEKLSSII